MAFSPLVTTVVVVLAVVGIIYGALVAMVQPDIKKLVAYSSVSHLGFVMLGIWAVTLQSVQGALMVMINHGLSTGALFFLIGMLYERRHTREIADFGGIARVVPVFASIFTLVALSSIGLPGLNGFVGEFLVLLGSFGRVPVGHRDRHHRRDLRGRLPALGAAADHLQQARQARERDADRPHPPRAGRAGAAAGRHRLAGALSGAGAPADGAGQPAVGRERPAGHRPGRPCGQSAPAPEVQP